MECMSSRLGFPFDSSLLLSITAVSSIRLRSPSLSVREIVPAPDSTAPCAVPVADGGGGDRQRVRGVSESPASSL